MNAFTEKLQTATHIQIVWVSGTYFRIYTTSSMTKDLVTKDHIFGQTSGFFTNYKGKTGAAPAAGALVSFDFQVV